MTEVQFFAQLVRAGFTVIQTLPVEAMAWAHGAEVELDGVSAYVLLGAGENAKWQASLGVVEDTTKLLEALGEALADLEGARTALKTHPGQLVRVRAADLVHELKLVEDTIAFEPTQTFRASHQITLERGVKGDNLRARVAFEGIEDPEFFAALTHDVQFGFVVLRD